MTRNVRKQREALFPFRHLLIGRPGFGWTGPKALKRLVKGEKFKALGRVISQDDFQSMCSALGYVEINWAMMEQHLDIWVHIIFQDLGGKAIEKEIPRSFWRKSDYLRRCFKNIPTLHQFATDANKMLDDADSLSETRNDLTHAVITHLEPRNGKYYMAKIDYTKTQHEWREVIFDSKSFPRLSADLVRLAGETARLGMRLQALAR